MLYLVHFTDGRGDVFRVIEALNADDAIERVLLSAVDDIDIRSAEPIEEPD